MFEIIEALFFAEIMSIRTDNVEDDEWEMVLKNVYYKAGKSGAFSSADVLKKVLLDEYGVSVTKKKIQNWLEAQHTYSRH
jgi:hypothetical protein